MVKHELVTWVKDGLTKGHELEKLLSNLKTQGYPDVDIVEVRSHVTGKKPAPKIQAKSVGGGTFMQVMRWLSGIFFEPHNTIKQIADHARHIHVALMGGIAVAVVFSAFLLNSIMIEGLQTLPSQVMNKFSLIISPQGSFAKIIGFGELSISGIFANIIAGVLHYFIPLLGIAFLAHMILKGIYQKNNMWTAYKAIGIPYGAGTIAISLLNLLLVPFLFIAEQVGSASFFAKAITGVILIVQMGIIFFGIAIAIYTYVAYAMVIKEKYETKTLMAIGVSVVSGFFVVKVILPLLVLLVASLF